MLEDAKFSVLTYIADFGTSHFRRYKMIQRFVSILNEAILMLYRNDQSLVERGGMEQACVSRIYYYLQTLVNLDTELREYNLDCEYNKNGNHTKGYIDALTGEYFATRPDIILHKRMSNDFNKVIIEFKGWWNDERDTDVRKLKAFINPDGMYRYQIGIFVKLNRNMAQYSYFKDAREITNLENFPVLQNSNF